MSDLQENIEKDQNNKDLRVIVLSAAPGAIFCAGHNLKELTEDKGYDFKKKVFDKCSELLASIRKSPVPVICKIDGLAAAAGFDLA